MASTQELLQAVLNLQTNAQESLPVLPNNGNPRGANNMPHGEAPAAPMPAGPRDWSQASPSMANIRQMLAQPIRRATGLTNMGYTGPMPGTDDFQAARAAGYHPIMDWFKTQHPAYVEHSQQVPLPVNTGIVPPNMQTQATPILPTARYHPTQLVKK